jgi:citrate/tricarballylate utilization protein
VSRTDLLRRGEHVLTICNACRYCEGYCPVFPAMELRSTFSPADLTYLANLCHNCGECLYSCQYAPPHEFALNVPRTLAAIRVASYEDLCWPRAFSRAFRRANLATTAILAIVAIGFVEVVARLYRPQQATAAVAPDFYAVVPHQAMVILFGGVMAFVIAALVVGLARFWREVCPAEEPGVGSWSGLRDAFTLTHLHGNGASCTSNEESRSPARRWCHHATMYGFGLCVASTCVAAIYHSVFRWYAPYPYISLPVILGTVGGVGLLVGPVGLFALKRRRDPALGDPDQNGLDVSFILLLFLTTVTGMLLLVARASSTMPYLLVTHLGLVLALFVTLPYGKFVHGIYRAAALVKYARESAAAAREGEITAPDPTSPYDPAAAADQVDVVVGAARTN